MVIFNERQIAMLNDIVKKGGLKQSAAGNRSTHYQLV